MANEINVSAQLGVTVGGFKTGNSDNTLLSLSSSNSWYGGFPQVINTGSWVSVNTGSAANIRYIMISNLAVSSSYIGLGIGGTGSLQTIVIQPNDFTVLPGAGTSSFFNNGNIPYWVAASGSQGLIQVVITQA